ncbi:serine/threonine protein kinase [Nocardia sp. CDC159]|uniref:non-specific serine/threonine protein kinase n=1 Tax=Nocardia pulmonis TaxID=2951408 RepID=A0A9X2E2H2_9NOCA|nr:MULTISPECIES: serine/threonine-protein kinase [Nocardia]MCM6771888.1 serine/threonine protein kinase [Nocardia pulmonis]MCM6785454.1 serine/threonine protein kinase [Nocardia sp. CDC159]
MIVERLGSGGMGTVYLAHHPRLPRSVALKVLDPELGSDRRFRIRFEREADLVAQLEHPNIVGIYDRGIEGGLPWISMHHVPGGDLARLIRRHRRGLDPRRAVHIVTEVAKGLDHAHRRGIVHRDVKPANIFLGTDGRVLIGDFGIARATDAEATQTGGPPMLTRAYAAPEQWAGGGTEPRTDVYALGVTLFELLTGRLPGTGVPQRLPPRLAAVIAKASASDPADRYRSCGELAAAATAALSTNPRRPIAAVAAGATVIAGAALTVWNLMRPDLVDGDPWPAPAMVEIPGPPFPLLCPTPYLKSDRGPKGLCTAVDAAKNEATFYFYYPRTGEREYREGPFAIEGPSDPVKTQRDGTIYVSGPIVKSRFIGAVNVGHRYDADRAHGAFARDTFGGLLPFQSAFESLPVCRTIADC